ncbi:helix-turn-helix domain-containing protein [Streptomyces sp. NPDC051940]|uniref:TetR/AcrR family transcriptional regulator n=1 Tax=Streptomyces sp. NPDC051940 TaxID=3155675 RepID=UPI003414BB65
MSGGTRMRSDAQRNRAQLIRAAREVFVGVGPDAPLEEIARRAGVGIATLYRRFPTREDLIRGVAVDTLTDLLTALDKLRALGLDPYEVLRRFMHTALDMRIGAVMPAIAGRFAIEEVLRGVGRDAMLPLHEQLVEAQAEGLIRKDVVLGDITLMIIRLSRPLPGDDIPEDRGIAHRQLEVYLDGLRPAAARERTTRLPRPAVGPGWFAKIRDRIARGGGAESPPAAS